MLSHHDYFSAITSPWPAPAGEVDFGRLYVYNFIVRNFIITQHYEKKKRLKLSPSPNFQNRQTSSLESCHKVRQVATRGNRAQGEFFAA